MMQFVQQNRGYALSIQSFMTRPWHPEIREQWRDRSGTTLCLTPTDRVRPAQENTLMSIQLVASQYSITALRSAYSAAFITLALSVYMIITSHSMTETKYTSIQSFSTASLLHWVTCWGGGVLLQPIPVAQINYSSSSASFTPQYRQTQTRCTTQARLNILKISQKVCRLCE